MRLQWTCAGRGPRTNATTHSRDTAVDLTEGGKPTARRGRGVMPSKLNRSGDYRGARRMLERVAQRIASYAGDFC